MLKIQNGQNNPDNTNICSVKSNGELSKGLLIESIDNGMDDNNSIFEEEEREEEREEDEEEDEEETDGIDDKNENDEQNNINELMITNNIKTVFIDSRIQEKPQNDINDDNILNSYSRTSSATFDYELNFYRSESEIRHSYISKLISKNIWNPNNKPKKYNSIFIFDWDDTLLPTTFLTLGGVFNEDLKLSEKEKEKLFQLEESVLELLNEAIEKGNVYIITNAGNGWVEYSAQRFYPRVFAILSKVKIISARGKYEKLYPGNSRQWKIQAFLTLLNKVNVRLVTNIVCIGDSLFEIEAGRVLASNFNEAFIKTIKFKEAPKLDELIKQLNLVNLQFGVIYSGVKNMTIRVEKKRKNE